MKAFKAHETAWLIELDGIELADFWQRALAFLIDAFAAFMAFLLSLIVIDFAINLWRAHHGMGHCSINIKGESKPEELLTDFLVPAIYFGLTTWLGKGRSLGKWLLRIRIVSLVHRHLSLWHAIERTLGYAAATLEFGFGFAQFFIHPYRRTVQDRIAETIVVKESSYRRLIVNHPAIPVSLETADPPATDPRRRRLNPPIRVTHDRRKKPSYRNWAFLIKLWASSKSRHSESLTYRSPCPFA